MQRVFEEQHEILFYTERWRHRVSKRCHGPLPRASRTLQRPHTALRFVCSQLFSVILYAIHALRRLLLNAKNFILKRVQHIDRKEFDT